MLQNRVLNLRSVTCSQPLKLLLNKMVVLYLIKLISQFMNIARVYFNDFLILRSMCELLATFELFFIKNS